MRVGPLLVEAWSLISYWSSQKTRLVANVDPKDPGLGRCPDLALDEIQVALNLPNIPQKCTPKMYRMEMTVPVHLVIILQTT